MTCFADAVDDEKMLRIEYLSGQDRLKNEKEVAGWLQENEPKILQVQMYLAKAPEVKVDEKPQANYAASIIIPSNDDENCELLLAIRTDSIYIERLENESREDGGTIAEVSFDSDNHLRVKKDAW